MFGLGALLEDDETRRGPGLVRRAGGRARPSRRDVQPRRSCSTTTTPPRLGAGLSGQPSTTTPAPCTTLGSCSTSTTQPRLGAGTSGRPVYDPAGAMFRLGVLVEGESDPAEARRWYERAAEHDHAGAMYNLRVLVSEDDPAEARHAGTSGRPRTTTPAPCSISGYSSSTTTPPRPGAGTSGRPRTSIPTRCSALESCPKTTSPPRPGAGTSGRPRTSTPDAMYNLGALSKDDDPAEASALVRRGRPRTTIPPGTRHVQSRRPARKTTTPQRPALLVRAWRPPRDHTRAIYNLGVLLKDSDPAEARWRWWEGGRPRT